MEVGKEKMRIAVVHGLLRGGAARRLFGTVEALNEMPDVVLKEFAFTDAVTLVPTNTWSTDWAPDAPARPRLVRPLWRYLDVAGMRSTWAHLWAEVNAWNPDVVFANPCANPGGAPPGLRGSRVPSVYYCDEPRRVDYEKDAARASNPLTRLPYAPMRRLFRADERASVRAAGALATNSAYTAGRIAEAYGREATVVTPGIAPIFGPGPQLTRRHVLSVGTLIPSKGHDLVVQAVAESGLERPVVLVGPRHEADEERRLHALADRLGVPLSIEVGISDERLADLYREAVVTMYLARDEPLGLVSLEAQACGTPVIVAAEGGLVETVDHGVGGLHVPRTAHGAADGLRRLMEPGELERLAAGAAARVIPRDLDSAHALLALVAQVTATTPEPVPTRAEA